ncbi:PREDICTED: glucose dehydrogenase [FAD, quinone]-like [Nicrophorus vespilloides]|uniref:Glucose dehydrogenase [FAD, quinone]-like n=1 Tax=Nicrophorus vespilloides TaxID=110193 RepID=A0ABM1MCW2_NICVS|nr:PREDICTED: glucose dehydrogenase [FAD, quinone]-like [Nicrophorus vespilloides]
MARVLVVLACLWACANCKLNVDVDYFTKMLIQEQEEALKYNLPINAHSYNGYNLDPYSLPNGTETYDYIIIGSGSGGSVVTQQLSEIDGIKGLLLEAGSHEDDFVDVPGMAFFAQGTKYNWNYGTVPQKKSCLGLKGKKCMLQRGKGFGGTTLINGLVYSRGSPVDYDNWAAGGNPGWSYKDVLPVFKELENSHINGDPGYHGTKGLMNVEYSKFDSPHLNAFLASNVELGRKEIDYNGREQLGVSKAQLNTLNGRRLTTGKAFISKVNCKNMKLSDNSYVTRILINPKTKTAFGVQYIKDNKFHVALAKREVILSAGTVASPQILMLSGIGPQKHLKEMGIETINDLQVGDNYKDHPCFYGLNILSNVSIPLKPMHGYVEDYLKGDGVLTLPGNNAGVGFFKTNFSKIPQADIEIMLISPNRSDAFFQKGFGFTDSSNKALIEGVDPTKTFTMYIDVLKAKSTGYLRLKSKNPFDYPTVNTKFLEDDDDHDIKTIYYAINLILEMLETKAMKAIDAKLGKVVLPECKDFEYLSKDYWYCTIRYLSDSLYHPVGTCKMGPDPKKGAVVDNKLRVHGIKNLRVADGSVFPDSLAGHPSNPIMMVAAKLVKFLKEDLKLKN